MAMEDPPFLEDFPMAGAGKDAYCSGHLGAAGDRKPSETFRNHQVIGPKSGCNVPIKHLQKPWFFIGDETT
jgi:hypothetical protein